MTGPGRMAEALLRTLGGRTVLLRMPALPVAGDLGEEVGLALPQCQDAMLRPVIFRREQLELLVSAHAVGALVGSLAFDSARILFAASVGVVIDGLLYPIATVTGAEAFGMVYLWRIGLGEPGS